MESSIAIKPYTSQESSRHNLIGSQSSSPKEITEAGLDDSTPDKLKQLKAGQFLIPVEDEDVPESEINLSKLGVSEQDLSHSTNERELSHSGKALSEVEHTPSSDSLQSGLPYSLAAQSGLSSSLTAQSGLPSSLTAQSGLPSSLAAQSGLPSSLAAQSGLSSSMATTLTAKVSFSKMHCDALASQLQTKAY